jgi:hypothetical protein
MQTITLPKPVFATAPDARLTERYGFIPTHELVSAFEREDWVVTGATVKNVRKPEKDGLQRHLIRFAHRSQLDTGRTERIETLVLNSHDGTSSLQLGAGVFRFACANGIIVADSTVATVRLGHHKLDMDTVLNSAHQILGQAEIVSGTIEAWKGINVSGDDAHRLAQTAIELRWGSEDAAPVMADHLLVYTRREADQGNDLWTVFNRVQENVLRSGVKASRFQEGRNQLMRSPRTIKALDATVKINRGLWEAANQIAMSA